MGLVYGRARRGRARKEAHCVTDGEADAPSWIRSTVLRDGACLTLVSARDAAGVIRGFGGDPEGGRRAILADLGTPSVEEPVAAIRDLGSWLLVVEPNGWQGSRPEVLRRVSVGGRAVSAYWNVNASARFSYVVDGRLLTSFEAGDPGRRHGADPDCLEEARSGLPWDDGDWVALMLALAGRVTGLRPGPEWLAREFAVVPLSPVENDPADSVYPPGERLARDDGPLAWALVRSSVPARLAVARIAARHAEEALAQDRARRAARESGTPVNKAIRHFGREAIREAGGPDPLAAAFKSVTAARMSLGALGQSGEKLRAEVMSALGNPAPPAGSLGLTARPGPGPADRYRWTDEHWLFPAGALRFTRGASLRQAATALGADIETARTGIPALSREAVVAFRQVGDWLVSLEGPKGSARPLRWSGPVPDGSVTVSLTWDASARNWVCYSADDTLVCGLDPQRPDHDMRIGTDPAFLDEVAAGLPLPFPHDGYFGAGQLPVMLVIAERLTGLVFEPFWLDEPHQIMNFRPRTAASGS